MIDWTSCLPPKYVRHPTKAERRLFHEWVAALKKSHLNLKEEEIYRRAVYHAQSGYKPQKMK